MKWKVWVISQCSANDPLSTLLPGHPLAAQRAALPDFVPLSSIVFELWVSRSGKSTSTSKLSVKSRSKLVHWFRHSRVYIAFYYAFRTLVPLPHHRTPWSASNAYWILLPFLPLAFMAYLARRRDTFAMRLLLLPSVIFLSVRFAYGCVSPSIPGARG